MSRTRFARHGWVFGWTLLPLQVYATPGDLELVTAGDTGAAAGGFSYDIVQSVSADGRYVLFRSDSDALVPGDENGRADLFLRDRQAGTTVRVNVNGSGIASNAEVGTASISDDGRYVVFDSTASNLVPGDSNQAADVFLRDLQAGTTVRVSVSSQGVAGDRGSSTPTVSSDGRYVAFHSSATNFVHNVRNGLYVRDRLTQRTIYLKGTAYGGCGWPRISGDGQYVAFECSWQRPEWPYGYGKRNGFLYERATDRVYGVVGGHIYNTRITDINEDGRYVAFHTQSPVVADDTNRMWDAYVYDRERGTSERVSITLQEKQANLHSYGPTLSRDGRYVAFESFAGNLVPDDLNRQGPDVFVRDRLLGTTDRVSVGTSMAAYMNTVEMSADGNVVTLVSEAQLLPVDGNDSYDVYVQELGAQLTLKPARVEFGGVAVGSSSDPQTVQLSNDGVSSMEVSWIGLLGSDSSQFATSRHCPRVLRPGITCSAEVRFAPSSQGAKAARLVVTTSDAVKAGSVPVTGTGE